MGLGGGGGGGGREDPRPNNSKTIHSIELKFGRVVENHRLINLVSFNWQMTSLCNNDVITIKNLDFYKILPIRIGKV